MGKNYKYTVDWSGSDFCGLHFDWNYSQGYVDVSMPNYVKNTLAKLNHVPIKYPQYSPHQHIPFKFGKPGTRQYAKIPDTSSYASQSETKHVQSTIGSFLYYARALDGTLLPALNTAGTTQALPTQATLAQIQRIQDYAATYPDVVLRFYASDMILHVDSDAAYLVLPKARSRIAGYFRLENEIRKNRHSPPNGAILIECKTIKHVVSSAAEAETNALFHNAKTSIPIRQILIAMGHPQPPTPIKIDNTTALGYVNDNIQLKKSKAWDMNCYWLRDREEQKQFNIFWERGNSEHTINEGDYYTKHHPTTYHRHIRPRYVLDRLNNVCSSIIKLRGCINPPETPRLMTDQTT